MTLAAHGDHPAALQAFDEATDVDIRSSAGLPSGRCHARTAALVGSDCCVCHRRRAGACWFFSPALCVAGARDGRRPGSAGHRPGRDPDGRLGDPERRLRFWNRRSPMTPSWASSISMLARRSRDPGKVRRRSDASDAGWRHAVRLTYAPRSTSRSGSRLAEEFKRRARPCSDTQAAPAVGPPYTAGMAQSPGGGGARRRVIPIDRAPVLLRPVEVVSRAKDWTAGPSLGPMPVPCGL